MSLGSFQLVAVFARSARVLHSSFYASYEAALKDAIYFSNKNLILYRDFSNVDELRHIDFHSANKSPNHYLQELSKATHRLNGKVANSFTEVPIYAVVALPCNLKVESDEHKF